MSAANKQPVKLDDEQLAELREIFRSFDRNKDGSLTQLELGSLLRSMGLKPSEDQLEALIQKADKNSNGMVEFSEFVAMVEPDLIHARSPYTEDQLRQIFRMFDRDGNGYITAAELAHSMAKLGHALTAEELTGMIKEADTDVTVALTFKNSLRQSLPLPLTILGAENQNLITCLKIFSYLLQTRETCLISSFLFILFSFLSNRV